MMLTGTTGNYKGGNIMDYLMILIYFVGAAFAIWIEFVIIREAVRAGILEAHAKIKKMEEEKKV